MPVPSITIGSTIVWKALARDPGVMEQFAAEMKAAFAGGQRIVDFDQAKRVYLLAR